MISVLRRQGESARAGLRPVKAAMPQSAASEARTTTSRCVSEFSAVFPVIAKVSSPVGPRVLAFSPARNRSGSTPMPTRLDRWIRCRS